LTTAISDDEKIAEEVALCYNDPLRFVLIAFEPMAAYDKPDTWQREILTQIGAECKKRRFDGRTPVPAIRLAISSGHGIGKSTLVAWLVCWIMSTRPNCQGTVTANTFSQLETKTWASITKWMKLCITAHWFEIGASKIYRKGKRESWFVAAQTCREENSESFAGQHAADSSSFYVFDEASNIPDKIWEVAEGGLTDGEPYFFAFGNPTRNDGKFHRVTFGSERDGRWLTRSIDSRDSSVTNKGEIEAWEKEYGEDSDFFRVRVKGIPPRASDLQFIDSERVYEASKRRAQVLRGEPLIVGIDIARGGGDSNCFMFRRGLDARSITSIRVPGEETRDSMILVSKIIEVLERRFDGQPPDIAFLDGSGVGGPIPDRLKQLGWKNVHEVQFGGKPPDRHYLNMRSFMWDRMKEWLLKGSISDDPQLHIDLCGPQFGHNKQDQLVLEAKENMKKRGLHSPDAADALALTFARPVAIKAPEQDDIWGSGGRGRGWAA
jgi:hypothetical protein